MMSSILKPPQPVAALSHRKGFTVVAFSPDGETLAVEAEDGGLYIWDTSSEPQPQTLRRLDERDSAYALAWSSDGRLLASGGNEGWLRVRETDGWGVCYENGPANDVIALAFSPDGRWLACASVDGPSLGWFDRLIRLPGALTIVDLADRDELLPLQGSTYTVGAVAISPIGDLLVAGADGAENNSIALRVGTWQRVDDGGVLRGEIMDVSFSPDGASLVLVRKGGPVELVDPRSWSVMATTDRAMKAHTAIFCPEWGRIAIARIGGPIVLWDPNTGQESYIPTPEQQNVNSLSFSQSHAVLATGCSDGKVFLWSRDGTL